MNPRFIIRYCVRGRPCLRFTASHEPMIIFVFRVLGRGRLLKAVPHHTRDALHTKLAEVYTLNRQFDEALESFHFAIR